ncbi:MAG: MFS transporter [Saprospiraceae bacterium]
MPISNPPTSDSAAPQQFNETLLLLILAGIQFTHLVDFIIIMPLGAQLMEIFQITPQQFSWIVSSYAGSACVMGFLSALFIDRFDRKTALLSLYVGFTIGTIACSFSSSYEFFLLARSFTGAFGGILAALVLSIIGDVFPFERRAQATGTVMTAFSVASVVGVPAGLYFAAEFGWRAPFLIVGGLSAVVCLIAFFVTPSMRGHLLSGKIQRNPVKIITNITSDPNQLKALLFNVVLVLGHFSIIPFIAPYMQINIGFDEYQITYVYIVGGIFTVVLLPLFGKLSDRFGNPQVFTIASVGALFSIFAITNLPPVSIALALVVTSSYFVVSSGRTVPATTLVTSVVKPENRGSFMSVRSSLVELALAVGSLIAGSIIVNDPVTGTLQNYHLVGYFAIGMSILAVVLVWRLRAID